MNGNPFLGVIGFNQGDLVVHEVHGIGRYLGIEARSGFDFIKLEYADCSYLFISVQQVPLLSLYLGAKSGGVALSQLGGKGAKDWSKRKQKVKNKVKDVSEKLQTLYQKRTSGFRQPYVLDAFAEECNCPFALTDDQESAMSLIRLDLTSNSPMNRLVCGDPGFGKTELAIRTALHIVRVKKQVIFLCPTTILSEQHFLVFLNRLSSQNISIAKLNRFTSRNEFEQIQKDFLSEKLSILIGTHRVLFQEISQNLGLLIIDEEQKFGVAQKEKIRELFPLIDTLYLSATPIPRTLHSSLIGMGNVSLIRTPPKGRMQIESFVKIFTEEEVKIAIQKELDRQGQIFFVNDKIEGLPALYSLVQKIVPQNRIAIIHGQMDKNHTESTMRKFVNKELDVLVTTSIVESGLDISNVNTILINNAQNFGLSQLYQLRGRVGRSSRQGYVYFFIKKSPISDDAKDRLESIQKLTHLGQGFEIAMRDLEIRGVGDLFGEEQSGYISDVGYQLYCKWLGEELQQKKVDNDVVRIEFSRPWSIPHEYIDSQETKLRIYTKISQEPTLSGLEQFKKQLLFQFGPIPKELDFLFAFSAVRVVAQERGIQTIKDMGGVVEIFPGKYNKICVDKILQDPWWDSFVQFAPGYVSLKLLPLLVKIEDSLEKEIYKVEKTRECIELFWEKI